MKRLHEYGLMFETLAIYASSIALWSGASNRLDHAPISLDLRLPFEV